MGFQAVWGSSDTDVWAVGDGGTAVHFDGQAWTLVAIGATENLTSVHGTGPNDVWVMGADGSNPNRIFEANEGAIPGGPSSSPDGQRIACSVHFEGRKSMAGSLTIQSTSPIGPVPPPLQMG